MSVYKRGDRWYYYIKIKGVRYRGSIPEARTKYKAQEAERKIRDEIFEGRYGKAQSNKTLKEFVEEVYKPWAKENKRSWNSDASRLKPILAYFGSKKMLDISPFLVEKFKVTRSKAVTVRGKQRSRTSVNRELELLSRIFSLAISNREVRNNPVAEVDQYKGEIRRSRYLLSDEEERLMAQFTGKRSHLRLIVLVALQTGMRLGEILKLRKKELDFHRGEIQVTRTKTDEDRRVPMNDRLYRELASHCSGLSTEYVFANPETGRPLVCIKRAFQKALEDAKIEDFRFHDLRHTAATRMGEAGIDPFTIAAILGHKSIAMTASYTHATQQAKRRAVAALEGAMVESGPQMGHKQQQRPKLAAAN
ncbi:MAG TPA: site-specific integrase [Blastocatellia bacterium]|nr:site-specific integrase [Blastocatellia bacterium]